MSRLRGKTGPAGAGHGCRCLRVSATVALAVALAAPASAQQVGARVGAGVSMESYTFSDADAAGIDGITLLTLPFAGRAPLGGRASLEVGGSWASGTLTRSDGTESTLSGLTDASILLGVQVVPDMLSIAGVVSLPTGTATHDASEAAVAGVVAADLLPFRISHWGAGGGVGLQVTGTRRFDRVGAGLSVAYRRAGEFDPVEGTDIAYRPGSELRVRLAMDTEVGRGGKGSLVVGLQRYEDDRVDGANLFQAGNRLEVTGTYGFPAGALGSAAVYGSVLHRASGQFLDPTFDASAPSQDLFLVGGLVRRSLAGAWITPRVDLRMFRSEDGVGQGYVGTAGASAEIGAGGATLIPTLRARFGDVEVREAASSGLVGFEAALSIRFGR